MELGVFERQLRLMVLLTQNREYTIEELCAKLDMSRRTLYRYLELFRDIGFEVIKQEGRYRLDKSSPFFKEITQLIHFTEDEALALRQVLHTLSDTDMQVRYLKRKLERIYDFGILNSIETDRLYGENLKQLYEAIKQHRQVILHDYSSANSNNVSSRLVEPFEFLNHHHEVRCFEPASGRNKSFKISRIGRVEVVDLLWCHEQKHRHVYTDLFHFSGEERTPVTLRLGRLACHILKEEYPNAAPLLQEDGENHWLLTIHVCSFQGIGRFVLGLLEDIEVVDSPEFMSFLTAKVEEYKARMGG